MLNRLLLPTRVAVLLTPAVGVPVRTFDRDGAIGHRIRSMPIVNHLYWTRHEQRVRGR